MNLVGVLLIDRLCRVAGEIRIQLLPKEARRDERGSGDKKDEERGQLGQVPDTSGWV